MKRVRLRLSSYLTYNVGRLFYRTTSKIGCLFDLNGVIIKFDNFYCFEYKELVSDDYYWIIAYILEYVVRVV